MTTAPTGPTPEITEAPKPVGDKDFIHKATKLFERHRYTVLGLAIVGGMMFWATGCDVKVTSLNDPGKKVTVHQMDAEAAVIGVVLEQQGAKIDASIVTLNAEIDAFNAALANREQEIQYEVEKRSKLIEFFGGLATQAATGTFNPVSAIGAGIGLLGLFGGGGAALDNRRKNKVIEKYKRAANGGTT